MIVKERTVPGRGIMTATHPEGTLTVIATIGGGVAVVVTVVAAAGVGARIALETVTETGTGRGIGTEIETGSGIEPEAGVPLTAELAQEAGVEVRH